MQLTEAELAKLKSATRVQLPNLTCPNKDCNAPPGDCHLSLDPCVAGYFIYCADCYWEGRPKTTPQEAIDSYTSGKGSISQNHARFL